LLFFPQNVLPRLKNPFSFPAFYVLGFAFTVITQTGKAQDSHYATYQFGTRSAMMGGAVIGSARENASIFYNPGSLGFVDSNSITLSANMYQVERIRIADAEGKQDQISTSLIGVVPLMVSGMLGQSRKRIKIGYGVITPVNFNMKANSKLVGQFPVVNDAESPGNEIYIGETQTSSQLAEIQGIIGVGYKMSTHWAFGISGFAIGRNQDFRKRISNRYFVNNGQNSLSSFAQERNASYFHLRMAFKLGLGYRSKRFAAGFTILPPSLGIASSGSIQSEIFGTHILYNGIRQDFLFNEQQDKLRVKYKSPLSLTAGINWTVRRTTYGLSAEYYAPQAIYTVMEIGQDRSNKLGLFPKIEKNQVFLSQKTGRKQVLNLAFAYEYVITRHVILVASIRSNMSYYHNGLDHFEGIKTEISTWNLYHIRSGLILKQGHSQLTVGFLYGFGSDQNRPQTDEFPRLDEARFLESNTGFSKASYGSLGFLLGYSFLLFDL